MAKRKNVTDADVGECVGKAMDASELAIVIRESIGKCQADDMPQAFHNARLLMVAARDLNEGALALLNQYGLQKARSR